MGTRGAWGFRVDGVDKVTYNHFDSYPDGLGEQILTDLKSLPEDFDLKMKTRDIRMIDDARNNRPTLDDIVRLKKYADTRVSEQRLDDWYCLTRNLQGQPKLTLEAGVMINSSDFLRDSLFCEWAYIVNLDDGTLEVYRGFQKAPHEKGRYGKEPKCDAGAEYYPVALIAELPLTDLPEPGKLVERLTKVGAIKSEDDE